MTIWFHFLSVVHFHLKSKSLNLFRFSALQKAKIPVRNIEEGRNVSMYKTNRDCIKVGPFSCPLVVSMRPIPKDQVKEACEITGRFTGN